jgi:hypothetical protein
VVVVVAAAVVVVLVVEAAAAAAAAVVVVVVVVAEKFNCMKTRHMVSRMFACLRVKLFLLFQAGL